MTDDYRFIAGANGSTSRANHLFKDGDETTLCSKVAIPFNQDGNADRNQTHNFTGFDNALSPDRWCTYCKQTFHKHEDEGDA